MQGITKMRFQTRACIAGCKTLLMLFNIIIVAIGLILLILGTWMKMSLTRMFEVSREGGVSLPPLLIFTGIAMIAVGFFACSCTAKGQPRLLYLYAALLFVGFILISGTSISGYFYRDNLKDGLYDGFKKTIDDYGNGGLLDRNLDNIQSYLHCCGASNYTDWFETNWANHTESVPKSCCLDPNKCQNWPVDQTQINIDGCYPQILQILESNLNRIAGGALTVAAFQILGIILSLCLARYVNKALYDEMQ